MPTPELSLIQANIPRSVLGILTQTQAKRLNIAPPMIVDLAAGASATLYNSNSEFMIYDLFDIQNIGDQAVSYSCNTPATVDSYLGILAGGVAAKDGLGSIVHLGNVVAKTITVYNHSASAAKLCIFKAFDPTRLY